MGCDIHLFTERKRTINNKPIWVNIDYWKKNPYSLEDEEEKEWEIVPIYRDRNYSLFGKLANVRNYSGNNVISNPKGLPEDISFEVKKESDYWGSDGHSHRYFTLKEMKDFFKENGKVKYSGLMDEKNAELVDSGKMPNSWCQGASPSLNYVYREWEYEDTALKNLINLIEERKRDEFWIRDNEERPEFDDEIRIVFWFDN